MLATVTSMPYIKLIPHILSPPLVSSVHKIPFSVYRSPKFRSASYASPRFRILLTPSTIHTGNLWLRETCSIHLFSFRWSFSLYFMFWSAVPFELRGDWKEDTGGKWHPSPCGDDNRDVCISYRENKHHWDDSDSIY